MQPSLDVMIEPLVVTGQQRIALGRVSCSGRVHPGGLIGGPNSLQGDLGRRVEHVLGVLGRAKMCAECLQRRRMGLEVGISRLHRALHAGGPVPRGDDLLGCP